MNSALKIGFTVGLAALALTRNCGSHASDRPEKKTPTTVIEGNPRTGITVTDGDDTRYARIGSNGVEIFRMEYQPGLGLCTIKGNERTFDSYSTK